MFYSFADHNTSMNSLLVVNLTVLKLQNLTLRLQTELDVLSAVLQALNAICLTDSPRSSCNAISTESYSVVDYSHVRTVL